MVAGTLLVVGTLLPPLLARGGGGPTAASTSGASLGVYVNAGCPSCITTFASEIDDPGLHYVMDFLNGASWSTISNPSWLLSQWANAHYEIIWGVPMLPNSGSTLAEGAAGDFNKNFVTLAQNFVASGQSDAIIRLGWEFNGSWVPWSADGQQANFIAYWHNIVTAMRSVPGANFRFEWNPAAGDDGVGNLTTYYPGNAYVDYIGLDVYDTSWGYYPGAQANFDHIETEPYGLNWVASFATLQNKPIVLPEWGLGWGASAPDSGPVSDPGKQTCGGDNPTFIIDMAKWIATHNVFEATYWDYGTSSFDNGANSNSAAALTDQFGS